MISQYSTSPDVYAFFDVSSGSYEYYPTDLFHHMFPWYLCGAKFDADLARFERYPVMPGTMDLSLWRGYCVPQLFCRWIPGKYGWLEKARLSYDDWMLSKAAETCPEFEKLKEELVDRGYDLLPYSELRALREELLHCGSGGPLELPPVHEFKRDFVPPQVSNNDDGTCPNVKYITEFVPGFQYVPPAGLECDEAFVSFEPFPALGPQAMEYLTMYLSSAGHW